jgi:hypothetical protein
MGNEKPLSILKRKLGLRKLRYVAMHISKLEYPTMLYKKKRNFFVR